MGSSVQLNEEQKEEVKRAVQEMQEQKSNKKEFCVLNEVKDDQDFIAFFERFFTLKQISD